MSNQISTSAAILAQQKMFASVTGKMRLQGVGLATFEGRLLNVGYVGATNSGTLA